MSEGLDKYKFGLVPGGGLLFTWGGHIELYCNGKIDFNSFASENFFDSSILEKGLI